MDISWHDDVVGVILALFGLSDDEEVRLEVLRSVCESSPNSFRAVNYLHAVCYGHPSITHCINKEFREPRGSVCAHKYSWRQRYSLDFGSSEGWLLGD